MNNNKNPLITVKLPNNFYGIGKSGQVITMQKNRAKKLGILEHEVDEEPAGQTEVGTEEQTEEQTGEMEVENKEIDPADIKKKKVGFFGRK